MTITRLHPPTNAEKFGGRAAHLYHLLRVENGVTTPDGPATLLQAFDTHCRVLLMRQKATGKDASGTPYRPTRDYPVSEVRPG